jgi:hypothetical protein
MKSIGAHVHENAHGRRVCVGRSHVQWSVECIVENIHLRVLLNEKLYSFIVAP